MDQVAMWTAITTFITAFFAYLNLRAKNSQQDARLSSLEIEHAKCEHERQALNEKLSMEWPSDHNGLVAAMVAMKSNGIHVTMTELIAVASRIKDKKIITSP